MVALARVASSPLNSDSELCAAVREFTIALRNAGFPPERVVVAVKAAVQHVVRLPRTVGFASAGDDPGNDLMACVVTCCITEFYRLPDQNPAADPVASRAQNDARGNTPGDRCMKPLLTEACAAEFIEALAGASG